MPPKGKGKGSKSSKGGWRSDEGTKAVTLTEFLASSGVGTTSAGSTSVGGVGAEVGALQTLVAALTQSSQLPNFRSQGPPRTIKLESVDDERRMVAAYALLKAKEADDETARLEKLIEEGVKAKLDRSPKSAGARAPSGPKTKKAKVDDGREPVETSSETEGADSPDPKRPSRGARHRKKRSDELAFLRELTTALSGFRDSMMGVLVDDKAGGSDDESAGARSGGAILRHLRKANRAYLQATPPPRGKEDPPIAKEKTPGKSSRTKTASRDLQFRDCEEETALSDSRSEESTKMKALLDHFAPDPPTPSSANKPNQTKLSPKQLFDATLDSLKGAALLVNTKKFPRPDEKYTKSFSKADTEIVAPIVAKLIAMMEKASKAMKAKRAEADKAALSMIVDGLGEHIEYRKPRGMTLNLYLTSVVVWLVRARTNFSQDPFLAMLIS